MKKPPLKPVGKPSPQKPIQRPKKRFTKEDKKIIKELSDIGAINTFDLMNPDDKERYLKKLREYGDSIIRESDIVNNTKKGGNFKSRLTEFGRMTGLGELIETDEQIYKRVKDLDVPNSSKPGIVEDIKFYNAMEEAIDEQLFPTSKDTITVRKHHKDIDYKWYDNNFYAQMPYWVDGLWVHNLTEFWDDKYPNKNGDKIEKTEQEFSFYKYSTTGFYKLKFKEKIQFIWKVLTTGKIFDDNEWMLDGKEAKRLGKYLCDETNQLVIESNKKKLNENRSK